MSEHELEDVAPDTAGGISVLYKEEWSMPRILLSLKFDIPVRWGVRFLKRVLVVRVQTFDFPVQYDHESEGFVISEYYLTWQDPREKRVVSLVAWLQKALGGPCMMKIKGKGML